MLFIFDDHNLMKYVTNCSTHPCTPPPPKQKSLSNFTLVSSFSPDPQQKTLEMWNINYLVNPSLYKCIYWCKCGRCCCVTCQFYTSIIAQTNYKLNSIFLYFRLSMGNAKEDYVGNRKSQICLQMGYLHNHIR